MTYREKIQEMIQNLQTMYDDVDGLRDEATMEEKKYWNALRGKLPDCWDILQKLDSSVSDKRASIQLL